MKFKFEELTEQEQLFLKESNAIEDVWDAQSLADAEEAWLYLKEQEVLTHRVILMAHRILMRNQDLMYLECGFYRDMTGTEVTVGGNLVPPARMVPGIMSNWVLDYLIIGWKEAHIRFEKCHPFVDGNGRLGRLLMNWQRLQEGLPVLVIKAEEASEYYDWFD